MYTELKSYQIIIALLKKYGIKHCVLSAGSRNVPFVHSVEEDPFFECYSVVDERSAGYFALGLSQQLQEPVVISCTASTASCNYWPPVAEAFYQGVPLVILTSDRNPAMLGQWEDQMIDQVGMFDRHVKKSVNLPNVENRDDFIHCQRVVNEALLELDHHGTGPVHINIPMKYYNRSFNCKTLPEVTKIERLDVFSTDDCWVSKIETLKKCNRILVTCGQSSYVSDAFKETLSQFFHNYNASISIEYMSNMNCDGIINSTVCMDSRYLADHHFKELLPEIVISYGHNITSGIKELLRHFAGQFEHWLIQEDGHIVDMYKSLTTIFECPPLYFFNYCNSHIDPCMLNNLHPHNLLLQHSKRVIIPEFEYSNIYAIKSVVENIPSKSILHLSINSSIRITNFFKLQPDVKVYANIGTYGIDGCLSSFLGQASVLSGLSFLIIGDLSFFYDMNALRLRNIDNNVRILMINNHGGEEFYYNKSWINQSSDLHTTARHETRAKGWVLENNFIYLSATDKKSFDEALGVFLSEDSEVPIFFEVFTEMKTDADAICNFYNLSRPKDLRSELVRKGKEFAKSFVGQEKAQKIVNLIKK
ncbi:2-succinyl-5-enolpyruvyl-6-hydroxy-3-cyclohexene-1-carboxylic-acid synthase [Bacteroides thetaiotaomicron]|uniref:2-succinyl-5-enolpyruvyl-6-hydroxy-3- cyclohexene-1-carboxylic-acid synthase n=1 Tax=Bacteroides thetaiotaomicron TaxID=818 RepID=UPI001CE24F36|nr:2-succinyl-5-enolpyruvyl-6-hydroxy-3-cyclohexene-1-carboxylic-acid synthase [Bacteroides thetaiotaomicron]MCA6038043.1 2-succinyl-5-enolpyruvyl-6-hydroxy-3-cyclohexene-1-carboxylic-acid synthase [Bacteroides thetaiotaomicron]